MRAASQRSRHGCSVISAASTMLAGAPQPVTAHGDRRASRRQVRLGHCQPRPRCSQAPGLGEPLPGTAIATHRAAGLTTRTTDHLAWGSDLTRAQRTPGFQHSDRGPQIGDLGGQGPHPQLVLVF